MREGIRKRESSWCATYAFAAGAAFAVASCGSGDVSVDGAGPTDDGGAAGDAMAEDAGPTIDVPRVTVAGDGVVELGAMSDVPDLVETVHIAVPYEISKYPITVSEYRACVEAGACKVPDLTPQTSFACSLFDDTYFGDLPYDYTYELQNWTSLREAPVSCMSPDLASDFCVWASGTLATAGEWMYAARGPKVQEYPWGSTPPTCEQNPSATTCPPGAPKTETVEDYWVGRHPKSASWVGMEDVLLMTQELMGREPTAATEAWASTNVLGIEVDSGSMTGRITAAYWVGGQNWKDEHHAWGFRCTWRAGDGT